MDAVMDYFHPVLSSQREQKHAAIFGGLFLLC